MDGQDGQDELGIKYPCRIFSPFAPSRLRVRTIPEFPAHSV